MMSHGKIKKIILWTLGGIGLLCCFAYAAIYFLLQSPVPLKYLASKFGYEVSAGGMSFSPGLSGRIDDLSIQDASGNITILCSNVTVKSPLTMLLTGQIDTLVLRNPRITFRSSNSPKKSPSKSSGKSSTSGKSDLSFLNKLPDVRLLDIQNAEIDYLAGDEQEIKLSGFNLTVKDFSPRKGGHISLRSNISYTSGVDTGTTVKGRISSTVQLSGVYPIPYGKGSLDLAIDSGEYRSGKKTVSLNDISLVAKLGYDKDTKTFTVDSLTGKSREFGALKGDAKMIMSGLMPWSLNLSLSAIDFSTVSGVAKPFLTDDMKGWTMQGRGGVETAIQGTFTDKQPSFTGTITLSFKDTGASSQDGSITAQGISGTVVLKLKYSSPDQKLAFNLQSVQQDGEYLWKEYYNNLKGQQASVTADGSFFLTNDIPFSVDAKLDLFQTGDYSISVSGNTSDWSAKIKTVNVSHEKVIEKLLKDYLNSSTSGLKGFSATGLSSLETEVRRSEGITYFSGKYTMTDTGINAPGMQFSIRNISVDLPFDLVYPYSAIGNPVAPAKGTIRFTDIRRNKLLIENLQIPLIIVQNALDVTERVVIPFHSGNIVIYDAMVDDLLSPDKQVRFGLKLEKINLGGLTQSLLDTELPGTINADFGVMRYQNNRMTSEGTAIINIFDGEIKASNFYFQDITLPSRKFGGDVTFQDINLEQLTGKIAIGRMSGNLRGSLKGFMMEYGQPSGFILEVESVKKKGIKQLISSDAINNISILGAGVGNILGRGITKYFKDFPYRKIGLRCDLKNDKFKVNGTIIEGDKEYLVRRGLFRGVDVINQNRNNVISFRDMEERVKRISRPKEGKSGGMLVQ